MPDFSREELDKEMLFDPQGRWYVGRVNLLPSVRPPGLPQRVTIKDETLREGEETPGVFLTQEQKLRVARALAEMGIRETEVGYAGSIPEHGEFCRLLKQEGIPLRRSSHARAYSTEEEWRREVERAAEAGVEILSFVGYISECRIAGKPGLSKKTFPQRVYDTITCAKQHGMAAAFGLADPVRNQLPLIVACLQAAQEAGVDRWYVYDGPGAATPEAIAFLTALAHDIIGEGQIAVHCHDDYGLALANTIAGIKVGATVVDAVVNGLGDRAGNTALEEVVATLEVLYQVETGIKLEGIYPLCKLVEELYGIPIAPNKALVGANQYRHATASHIVELLKGEWYTMENIRAEALGQRRTLEFGPAALDTERSGAIGTKIAAMGLAFTDAQLQEVIGRVKEIIARHRFATEEQVEEVIREVVGDRATRRQ